MQHSPYSLQSQLLQTSSVDQFNISLSHFENYHFNLVEKIKAFSNINSEVSFSLNMQSNFFPVNTITVTQSVIASLGFTENKFPMPLLLLYNKYKY